MYLTGRPSALIGPPGQDSRGTVQHDLVTRDLCGCADGEVALLEIQPGSTYEVTQTGESGSILLDEMAQRPPGTTNDTESMSSFSASQTVRGASDERPETR
jgi:hypothetical protein